MDKIITTILSFDDLLFTASVRQVVPESAVSGTVSPLDASTAKPMNETTKEKVAMSMSNPVYESQLVASKPLMAPLKYHTKIDAGIRINDLTQEVNMPLLRLVHQIYSIIADSIEYDKEQASSRTMTAATSSLVNTDSAAGPIAGSKMSSFKTGLIAQNQLISAQNFVNSRDCWRYMAGLIELKDFLPEPKHVEKVD